MAYSKTTWVTGDTVTATKLNHAEDGIASAQSTADGAAASVAALGAAGAIGTSNLADASVTNAKLDQEAVDTDNIRNGAITTPLIYDGAVTGDKIADGAITDAKLAASGVKSDVADLKSAVNMINGAEPLVFIDGAYIVTSGETVDVNTTVASEQFRYAVASCVEGDVFTLNNVVGGNMARQWCFIDDSGNVLSVAVKYFTTDTIAITAPENADKVIVQDNGVHGACYKGVPIHDTLDGIDQRMDDAEAKLSAIVDVTESESYHQLTSATQTENNSWSVGSTYVGSNKVSNSGWYAVEFPAKPNTQYVIKGKYVGTTQNYGIGFFANDSTSKSMSQLFNATQQTWKGKSNCTVFTTPDYCTYVRFNCKTSASEVYEYQTDAEYSVDENAIPNTIQRTSDNNLETINKTIVGAINEIFDGGSSGSFIPWALAPNGDTDMTSAILAKLNTYGICQLQAGTYVVTNLDMPANTMLMGVGSASVLKLSGTDSTAGYAVKLNTGCTVKNLKIIGSEESISLSSSLVNRHGILWQGTYDTDQTAPHKATVENVWINRFKGGGITCRNTGTPVNNCINVTDVFIQECRAGINVSYSSEFNRFENVHSYGCYYGCVNNGGNNTFVNCSFSSNTLGFIMGSIDSDITLSNVQHGSAIGCVFNHSHANAGTGIKIDGGGNGFVFSGCQMFYSEIDLDNTSGIVFDAMNFGAQTINIDDCAGAILFANCMFGSSPTVNKTNSANVNFANCYVRSTGASVTA